MDSNNFVLDDYYRCRLPILKGCGGSNKVWAFTGKQCRSMNMGNCDTFSANGEGMYFQTQQECNEHCFHLM